MRQLLTESFLLVGLAVGIALLLAQWSTRALVALIPADIPRAGEAGINGSVLLFTVALAFLTGLVFGLVPALKTARTDLVVAMKTGGGGRGANRRSGPSNLLIGCEVALALVLLAGAGLLMKSFMQITNVDPGYDPENVVVADTFWPNWNHRNADGDTDWDLGVQFRQTLQQRIEAHPDVEAVAISNNPPFFSPSCCTRLNVEAADGAIPAGSFQWIATSPGYLGTMGLTLLRGRELALSDLPEAGRSPLNVVINNHLARRLWPDADPIGKRLKSARGRDRPWMTVVGVVEDAANIGIEQAVEYPDDGFRSQVYTVGVQRFFIVRTRLEAPRLERLMLAEAQRIEPGSVVGRAVSLKQLAADSVARPRFYAVMVGIFAAVAVFIALVGIFGVIQYAVGRRTHEIGLRMALGAQRGEVVALVLRQGMLPVIVGVLAGVAGAVALSRVLTALLYGMDPIDSVVFAGVSLGVVAVALLASYVPARAAARIAPINALRAE